MTDETNGTPMENTPKEEPAGATALPTASEMPRPDPEGYKQKLCPIMSVSIVKATPETDVMACQGPRCMMFVPIAGAPDENGKQKMIDGQCGLALISTSISMLTNTAIALDDRRRQEGQGNRQPLVSPAFGRNNKR